METGLWRNSIVFLYKCTDQHNRPDNAAHKPMQRQNTADFDEKSVISKSSSEGQLPRSVSSKSSPGSSIFSRDGVRNDSTVLPPVSPWLYRPSWPAGGAQQRSGLSPYFSVTTGPHSTFWRMHGPPGIKSRGRW